MKDRNGRRLENPNDFVRLEVEAALARDVPVIPLLVHDAQMPDEEDLPESLSELVYRHALELNDTSWRHDVGRLLARLKRSEQEKLRPQPSMSRQDREEAIQQRTAANDPKTRSTANTRASTKRPRARPEVIEEQRRRESEKPRKPQDRTGLPQRDMFVHHAAFSPDGRLLALAGEWRMTSASTRSPAWAFNKLTAIRIVDVKSRAKVMDLTAPGYVSGAAFTPDNHLLASGGATKAGNRELATGVAKGDGGVACIWDVKSGNKLRALEQRTPVSHVAFSPDGSLLATGSMPKIWSVASGERLLNLKSRSDVYSLAFSPDGSMLATGSLDKMARLWETDSGEEVLALKHSGSQAFVRSVAFESRRPLAGDSRQRRRPRLDDRRRCAAVRPEAGSDTQRRLQSRRPLACHGRRPRCDSFRVPIVRQRCGSDLGG